VRRATARLSSQPASAGGSHGSGVLSLEPAPLNLPCTSCHPSRLLRTESKYTQTAARFPCQRYISFLDIHLLLDFLP
jgi:hypothetical protein